MRGEQVVGILGRTALVVLLGMLADSALAVPAFRGVVDLRQPDGRSFRARLWGDERQHGHETEDGFTVEQDRSTRFWHFVGSDESGAVRRLSARPGIDPAPGGLRRGVRPRRTTAALPLRSAPQAVYGVTVQALSSPAERALPATGIANVPVFLVNYTNTTITFPAASFETLLFSSTFSMAAYYSAVSYGAYTVSSGPEGIAGWFTAAREHDYYGENTFRAEDGRIFDAWPGDLVHDAVAAADGVGFDFAPYDQDGDCLVDNVLVIHQGGGEEAGGPTTDIWSHSWDLYSAQHYGRSNYSYYTTQSNCTANPAQKVIVNKYTLQPELNGVGPTQTTVGVVAHEFGHALGLPDLYDTDGSSQGAGDWTIMASGSWNGVAEGGDRPAHLSPWEKWRLGWITPIAASCSTAASLPAASSSPAGIYRLRDGTPTTGEYFLVENRQNTSAYGFDDGLPGNGLLIWHVDAAKSNNTQECWPGPETPPPLCSAEVHYKVAVVQADNLWQLEKDASQGDTGDPFPGTSGRTTFNASSTPNSNLYSGAASGAAVTAISASGATMTATLAAPGTPTLTVTQNGTGGGTVSSSPAGIDCGTTCAASFSCGTPVSLSAVAAAGSTFDGWSGDCDGVGACSVTMDRAHTVAATFSALPSKLSIGDATLTEGSDGTKVITFTVTRTP